MSRAPSEEKMRAMIMPYADKILDITVGDIRPEVMAARHICASLRSRQLYTISGPINARRLFSFNITPLIAQMDKQFGDVYSHFIMDAARPPPSVGFEVWFHTVMWDYYRTMLDLAIASYDNPTDPTRKHTYETPPQPHPVTGNDAVPQP
jgi:hypothetical protein